MRQDGPDEIRASPRTVLRHSQAEHRPVQQFRLTLRLIIVMQPGFSSNHGFSPPFKSSTLSPFLLISRIVQLYESFIRWIAVSTAVLNISVSHIFIKSWVFSPALPALCPGAITFNFNVITFVRVVRTE